MKSLLAAIATVALAFVAFADDTNTIIYATLDEEFDRKASLYSFPSRFGKERALKYSSFFHLAAFGLLIALFFYSVFSLMALPLLLLTGYLLYMEQKKAEDVELAFFKINAVAGFCVFVMVLVGVYV